VSPHGGFLRHFVRQFALLSDTTCRTNDRKKPADAGEAVGRR
jgi:hypothetical protein